MTTRRRWEGATALRRSLVAIDTLEPWPDNPRRGDVAAIVASLQRWGQVRPILVQGSRIVAGHHLVLGALEMGWTHIAAVAHEFADDEEARAYLLADNRIPELGYIDDELLAVQLEGLRSYEAIGYSDSDREDLALRLAMLRADAGDADADAVPPAPARPKSKTGHVYELGPHRLACGDAGDADLVAMLTDGVTVSAVVTDPPYGIDREGVTNDNPTGLRALFDRVLAAAPVEDAVVVAFQSPRLVTEWLKAIEAAGHRWERMLWLHRSAAKTYPWRGWVLASDAIAVSSVGSPRWPTPSEFCHDTYVKTEFEDASLTGVHTTIKPSWVIRDIMAKIPAGPVYEPFAGSGTAVIAAEQLGRRCLAVEVEPAYCDVIRRRYADYVGDPSLSP